MIEFNEFKLRTPEREILVDITSQIQQIVRESEIKNGICRVFIPHTTAGVTINENADPSVQKDIINYLKKLIPHDGGFGYNFRHGEGNSDAHVKSSFMGSSLTIFIHNNRLMLGTWQGCYFTEFDGPRNRNVFVQLQGDS
jgi:secondary thiamine-phosphate synthase enzyme